MIKAEELRLGNLVQVPTMPQLGFMKVQALTSKYVNGVDYNIVEPIPLSEEWLLKFGFQNHPDNPFWFKRGSLMIGLIGVAEMMNELGSTVRISSWVNNVHQVQNLVHSLSGEELTIKN